MTKFSSDGDAGPQLDEHGIAAYRRELNAEAEIARGDLDEIEDHLRALAIELRASGLTGAAAVAEAARRLGEPRALAREHARVRSAFGARLSRLRSWGAAALLAPFGIYYAATSFGPGAIMWLLLLAALLSRSTWARACIAGVLPFAVVASAVALMGAAQNPPVMTAQCVATLAAAALLVPWRRGELTPAGWALFLLAPAYVSQVSFGSLQLTGPDGAILGNAFPTVMLVGLLVAFAGTLLRARWAAIGGALVAIALPLAALAVWPLFARFANATAWRAQLFGIAAVAEVGMVAATVMMWRGARSTFGTLRALRS